MSTSLDEFLGTAVASDPYAISAKPLLGEVEQRLASSFVARKPTQKVQKKGTRASIASITDPAALPSVDWSSRIIRARHHGAVVEVLNFRQESILLTGSVNQLSRRPPCVPVENQDSGHLWTAFSSKPRDLDAFITSLAQRLTEMNFSVKQKSTTTFFGFVEIVNGDEAVVSLLNEQTGDRIEAECSGQALAKEGIREGDEFRCDVQEDETAASVRFSRITPNELTKEQIAAILKEVEDVAL
jgi:hypothetical protein